MMFAPHPDDESLAAGVFLQRAVAAGAAIRIVYCTDGEKNCWPQRILERKVRIGEGDQNRWGARRRAEAIAALRVLQIDAADAEFLSLPDQGITDLLLRGCNKTIRRLASAIINWQPTHLLVPSALDTHPDHSGLAVLLRIAFDNFLPPHHGILRLYYLVHGASESFARAACDVPDTLQERQTKRHAIVCHASQVALSRRRFLSYAKREERFVFDDNRCALGDGPIRSFARARGELLLRVAFALRPLRAKETSLFLIGRDAFGGLRSLRATLPGRSARINVIDCATGAIAAIGRYQGDAFQAEIFLPINGFALSRSLYLKLDRRAWFFDEAGWLEIGPALPGAPVLRPSHLTVPELAVA